MRSIATISYIRSHSLFFKSLNCFIRKQSRCSLFYWGPKQVRKLGLFILKRNPKINILLSTPLFVSQYKELKNDKFLILHDNLTFEEEYIYGEKRNSFEQLNKDISFFVSQSKHIFTVSKFSRTKLIKQFNLEENDISVVYPQINYPKLLTILKKEKKTQNVYNQFKFDEYKYNIIFIGSSHVRKNIGIVHETFKYIKKELGDDIRLFIISSPREDITETYDVFNKMAKEKNIVQLSFVKEDILYPLVYNSDIFILPTLEEGFGMPNVEAQLCETAVVSSNVSCIPEVLGDSALLCNPMDAEELAKGCMKILSDKEYCNYMTKLGMENGLKYVNYDNEYGKIINKIREISG